MGGFKLSNFLQVKFNIFLYRLFGWGLARVYIFILGKIYFLIKRDEKLVIEFLKKSGVETGSTSRTIDAISSATALSETRILRICSRSTMIKKHGKDTGSWTLS